MTAPVSPPQPRAEPVRQHTPTPWRLCTRGNLGSAIEAPSGKSYYDGDDGYRIVASYQECCASEYYAEQDANRIANGLLIVEAVNSHASLKARAEQAEQEVYLLESNAREQAKLLADTGRRVEELEAALRIAREAVWSGGDTLRAITVIDKALPQSSGVARSPTEPSS